MQKYLRKLVDERNSLSGLMQTMTDKAAAEDRELTEPEAQRMRDWQERAAQLDRECGEQAEYLESQRSWARLQDQLAAAAETDEPERQLVGAGISTRGAGPSSWGEAFVNSPAFRAYEGYGSSGRVDVSGLFETRAPIDTTWYTVPPSVFVPTPWTMTTPLLDAVGHERVSNGNVEWISYPGAFPEAGEVAEGALKPEATFAPTENAAALKTFAHWQAITRQALEDIPRVQSIVENALRQGVLRKLENDTATAVGAATGFIPVGSEDMLTGIRIAIGEVQSAGYTTATGILLNPADFAALDIAVMGSTVNGPKVGSSFWGVPAIPAAAIPVNTAYVGDLKTGITLFERGSASVYMTDSHADNFIRNVLVILAETRALPVVTQAQAVAKVTVTPPVGTTTASAPRSSGK
jgi:HK97 family phage major capsid protein